ncbi:peroxisomal membrane protein 11D-like isoform X2 [Henckelia pumila]|uniref:peroxisomal membrane protein 11D-like isoform X2 n=1 Tax=Henckelia pumila TaxID=405737 RepID=UPI003C6E4C60
MSSLDVTRAELALAVLYLNKAETRDKICRSIQYGSRFLANGEPGTTQNVEKSVSLAQKVLRFFKVRYLKGMVNLCGSEGQVFTRTKNVLIGRISVFCWLGSSSTLVEWLQLACFNWHPRKSPLASQSKRSQ